MTLSRYYDTTQYDTLYSNKEEVKPAKVLVRQRYCRLKVACSNILFQHWSTYGQSILITDVKVKHEIVNNVHHLFQDHYSSIKYKTIVKQPHRFRHNILYSSYKYQASLSHPECNLCSTKYSLQCWQNQSDTDMTSVPNTSTHEQCRGSNPRPLDRLRPNVWH